MASTFTRKKEISIYWDAIKNANDEIKLKLISMLSDSIADKHKSNVKATSSEIKTCEFLDKFAGSWKGSESAENIIDSIKLFHSSKNPPLFD